MPVTQTACVSSGVSILRGRAVVLSPNSVSLNGKTYTTKHILVATGSWPTVPEIPGRELAITSNEAFFLPALPKSAIVVGGGYIAVEFASIFSGLGIKTTLVYRGKRVLRGFDADLGTRLAEEMRKKGIEIRFESYLAAYGRLLNSLKVSHVEYVATAPHNFAAARAAFDRFQGGQIGTLSVIGLEDDPARHLAMIPQWRGRPQVKMSRVGLAVCSDR